MKRAVVIGSPGAGKSTFARRLRDETGLPLYYLDMLWHKADGTHVSREEFDAGLEGILRRERWILDGNYLRTLEPRLRACDTVFLLDCPAEICLSGARARVGRRREDLPWVERELDEEFRQWIVNFPREQLPRIYEQLEAHRAGREVFVFRSREEADAYFDGKRDLSGMGGGASESFPQGAAFQAGPDIQEGD